MISSRVLILLLIFGVTHNASEASPPEFIPEQLFKNLPKPAAIIQHEIEKLLGDDQRSIVAFDVHGIFSKELQPSEDGRLTLSNRFIPTLELSSQRAQALALSAHDKPEVLYSELRRLKYGPEEKQNLYSMFAEQQGKPEQSSGILLFPLADKKLQIIRYAKLGNILSASVPGSTYYREKAIAALLNTLNQEDLKSIEIAAELYDTNVAQVRKSASVIAETIAGQPNKYLPLDCITWNTIPQIRNFIFEAWHTSNDSNVIAMELNTLIEKEVCGRIVREKRTYPNGKPSIEQKNALQADMRETIQKILDLKEQIAKTKNPKTMNEIISKISESTKNIRFVFIEDSFENLNAFQKKVLESGYFQDSKIYLQYAKRPDGKQELDPKTFLKKIAPVNKSDKDLKGSN